MIVNKKQLSDVLGITERTLTEWQKNQDFPFEKDGNRGEENHYCTSAVIKWWFERVRVKKKESNRSHREELEVALLELKVAREYDEVVPAAEIEQEFSNLALNIRKTIAQGDTKLKGELDVIYGIDVDIEILNEHSRSVLSQLSAYDADTAQVNQKCDEAFPATTEDGHE